MPTVELAHQQFAVVSSQIPGVQSKLLLGSDNVDKWAGPHVWEECLTNVRIVVSTFQILFDALQHAMVPLGALGLIVFDEGVCFHAEIPDIVAESVARANTLASTPLYAEQLQCQTHERDILAGEAKRLARAAYPGAHSEPYNAIQSQKP